MTLIAKEPEGGNMTPLEPGVYMANCYMVADIGEQYNTLADSWKQQIIIGWELQTDEELEQPRTIHKFYTMSLHKRSKLRPDLETWRGRPFSEEELHGFDLRRIIGVPCQLQLESVPSKDGSKTYTNIKAIMALPKAMRDTVPEPTRRIAFDLDTDLDQLEFMPTIVQNAVAKSRQMQPEAEPLPFDDADAPLADYEPALPF